MYIWLHNGEKMPVTVPEGCLLIQSGKMLEILTGGEIMAGFHEVIIDKNTVKKIEERKKDNKSLWRVSSTLFSTINYNEDLYPLEPFQNSPKSKNYQRVNCLDYVEDELKEIKLFK